MRNTSEISKLSPAKINLFLEVVKKRPDGYHDLESLMTFCNFGDTIAMKKSKAFSINFDGEFGDVIKLEENIICRLINKIEQILEKKIKVNIQLTKNLPIASGLGGGSSNAATALKCIMELYGIKFSRKKLNSVLFELGADVPFCYYGKSAIITGIGNISEFTTDIPNYHVLLVNPLRRVPTAEIFKKISVEKKLNKKFVYTKKDLINTLNKRNNDLEHQASNLCKDIKEIKNTFTRETKQILTRMTGSGATCFGLYKDLNSLYDAEKIFKLKSKKMWIKKTRIVNNIL
tara:strand:+ start:700 stop:1566 length:867 start_codon:yes stop_codon:yes gene_type:complete